MARRLTIGSLIFAGGILFAALIIAAYFTGINSGFESASMICTLEQANPLAADGGAI